MFSKFSIFTKARVQLVLFYAFVFLVMVIAADRTIEYNRTKIVEGVIQEILIDQPDLDSRVVAARREALVSFRYQQYKVFTLFGIVVAGIMYVLASSSLRPINKIIELQRRFIANASHELRTPLSVMKTQSEVALRMKRSLSKEELETVLRSNISQINYMSEVINTLLRISSSTSSSRSVTFSPLVIAIPIEKAISSLLSLALSKKITITTEVPHTICIVGNGVAFEEIMINVLQNAIMYTPEGGKVHIYASQEGKKCRVAISDTGVGISAKDLPHIFNPFFRGHLSPTYSKHGSGLGLTLVKELVTLHKGTISLASTEGQGTVVSMFFPILK